MKTAEELKKISDKYLTDLKLSLKNNDNFQIFFQRKLNQIEKDLFKSATDGYIAYNYEIKYSEIILNIGEYVPIFIDLLIEEIIKFNFKIANFSNTEKMILNISWE